MQMIHFFSSNRLMVRPRPGASAFLSPMHQGSNTGLGVTFANCWFLALAWTDLLLVRIYLEFSFPQESQWPTAITSTA